MKRPKYRRHSQRNKGFAEYKGKRHYFPGAYGSPESTAAYEQFVLGVVQRVEPSYVGVDATGLTVRDLCVLHLDALQIERDEFGTNAYTTHRSAYRRLTPMFGDVLAVEFGPLKLDEWQQHLARDECARQTVKEYVSKVRGGFRWGASKELIPVGVWQALKTVKPLQPNRTSAKEPTKKETVAWETVAELLPHLSRPVAAMVTLQYHTGVRSRSICEAKPEQFELGGEIALWRPRHKTEARGELVLPIGPKALAALRPYLERDAVAYCFQPREVSPHPRYNDHYTSNTYGCVILRTQERHELPRWTPHQLRHSKATVIREKYGIEAAQAILGHSTISTTELYSSRRLELAIDIAKSEG